MNNAKSDGAIRRFLKKGSVSYKLPSLFVCIRLIYYCGP